MAAGFDKDNCPMHVTVPAFNRMEGSNRCKFTIEVYFEGQHPWRLEKTYTELLKFNRELEVSQYGHLAKDFPPKHPAGLKMSMALRGRQSAMKLEVDFLKERLQRMETFLNALLYEAGPDGVDEVIFLNKFFNAFTETKEGIEGHADLDRSMLHLLKSCRIPKMVYRQLWSDGFTLDTIHTIERERWTSLGVAIGCIEQLETKLGGLRHLNMRTIVGPNGAVTSVATDPVTGALRGTFSSGAVGMNSTVSTGSMTPLALSRQQSFSGPQMMFAPGQANGQANVAMPPGLCMPPQQMQTGGAPQQYGTPSQYGAPPAVYQYGAPPAYQRHS